MSALSRTATLLDEGATRAEARQALISEGINARTADKYLKDLCPDFHVEDRLRREAAVDACDEHLADLRREQLTSMRRVLS